MVNKNWIAYTATPSMFVWPESFPLLDISEHYSSLVTTINPHSLFSNSKKYWFPLWKHYLQIYRPVPNIYYTSLSTRRNEMLSNQLTSSTTSSTGFGEYCWEKLSSIIVLRKSTTNFLAGCSLNTPEMFNKNFTNWSDFFKKKSICTDLRLCI